MVFSPLETSSFFSWACSSCTKVASLCSVDRDAARLVALGARQVERQQAVAILRLDAVGVDLDRERDGAIELAAAALAAMHARLLVGAADPLGAGDAQRGALDLDLEVRALHARHLGEHDDV